MTRSVWKCGLMVIALSAFVMQLLQPPKAFATNFFWKNNVITGNWSNGNNWSATGPTGADNAGAPNSQATVSVAPTTDGNRAITYDNVGPSALTSLTVDLTNYTGANTTTLSMSANNLSTGTETVGLSGSGAFTQSGGNNTNSGGLSLGQNLSSKGVYSLSGSGSLVTNGGIGEVIGFSGTGIFTQFGGTNTVNGNSLNIGNATGAVGVYTLSGGSLTANMNEIVGYSGTGNFTQSGGSNTVGTVPVIQNLFIGYNGTGLGSFTLNNAASTLTVNGNEYVGFFASGTSGGGTITQYGGTFNQTAGTHTVTNSLFLGESASSSGSFSLGGGSLAVGTTGVAFLNGEYVGYLGTGSFTQFGGSHTLGTTDVNQNLFIGESLSATGIYSMNNATATLTVNGNAYLGGSNTAAGGTGTLDVSAGTATITGTLKIWNTLGSAVNLSGGALNVGAIDTSGNPSGLNWTGGTLNFFNSATIDSSFTLGPLVLNAPMALSTGGTLTDNGQIYLGGGTLSAGNLVVNGTLSFQSGTLNITGAGGLTISPTGPLKDNVTLGSGQSLNVSSSTIVASGSSLSVSGGTFTAAVNVANAGNIVLNSGALKLNGGLNNSAGGLFVVGQNSTATVNNTLTNASEIQLGGGAATLSGSTGSLNNVGLIRGDGVIAKSVNNNAGGEIRAEAGKRIKLTGVNGLNAGRVNLQGGTAEFTQALTNDTGGQILGRGTLITGGTGLTNNGYVVFSSGISDVYGDVNNNTGTLARGITVTGQSNVTFWDDFTNGANSLLKIETGSSATFFAPYAGAGISGSGAAYFESDISPGFSPATDSFGGNVSMSSTANLKMELGGTTAGSQFDQVHVSGQLALDGTLQVVLINAFSPAVGNTFDILDWGTLSGTFSSIQLPMLTGARAWNTSQLYTTGVLSVISTLLGDYNGNGIVDAADYTVWRDTLGSTTDLRANGDNNGASAGKIDQADYDFWKSHYGNHAGSGAGATTAVPEPATLFILLIGILSMCCRRRPKCRKLDP